MKYNNISIDEQRIANNNNNNSAMRTLPPITITVWIVKSLEIPHYYFRRFAGGYDVIECPDRYSRIRPFC